MKKYILVYEDKNEYLTRVLYFENEALFLEKVTFLKKNKEDYEITSMGEFKEIEIEAVNVVTKYRIKLKT